MKKPVLRKEKKYVPLTKVEYRERFDERFYDPEFSKVKEELDRVFEIAWDGYIKYRKSPRKKPAGKGLSQPEFEVPIEWLQTKTAMNVAERKQKKAKSPTRILIINGSSRSEHSCPGEISKTSRLAEHAKKAIEKIKGCEVDYLDLSSLTDEPLKTILPCKSCVSTSPALCHWPCSCYPNHAMGQTNDWMNELYPRWIAAHGVMILCPVNWYQAPSSLKLMMDRLVCADGGNPDLTTTNGKDPVIAKKLELEGWDYPKHLADRAFSVVVHGDAAGPENLRRILVDWLTDIGMIQAGPMAAVDTFIGYYQPYATSHNDLDQDHEIFERVKNSATSVVKLAKLLRSGKYKKPDEGLQNPNQK